MENVQQLIDKLQEMALQNPNDYDLGSAVRILINNLKKAN